MASQLLQLCIEMAVFAAHLDAARACRQTAQQALLDVMQRLGDTCSCQWHEMCHWQVDQCTLHNKIHSCECERPATSTGAHQTCPANLLK